MDHKKYMQIALKEALLAFDKKEVPVGAIIVCNDQIIAKAHNLTETLNDPTAHAEMQAITSATNYIGGKYLKDCILYVTLEPCNMCAGALFWAQIGTVVYGARDEKRGFSKNKNTILHPKTIVIPGILENECADLLSQFFKKLR
jgi:tRNA(adenine34) deaminase